MKKILISMCYLLLFTSSFAKIRIITTYPYIKDIVKQIGKTNVRVDSLATGNWDPHFVVPRPSHIAKLRKANLLIINGAQLEIGWLPPLLNQSANPNIQIGSNGFMDLSGFLKLIEKPESISRSGGDIHPDGNPHFYLDPFVIPRLAKAITNKLCEIDKTNTTIYRENLKNYLSFFDKKTKTWVKLMLPLKGTKIIQYHKLFNYFLKRFGLVSLGEIEPLPGIPPKPKHTEEMINLIKKQNVKFILQDVYHSKKAAYYIASKTNAKVLILPQDVGAVKESKDIISMFDEIIKRFLK